MSKLIIPPELAGAKYVFPITRTSHGGSRKESPCEEAIATYEKHETGLMLRRWIIAFADLDDLLRFADKYENVIVTSENGVRSVEICDTWFE